MTPTPEEKYIWGEMKWICPKVSLQEFCKIYRLSGIIVSTRGTKFEWPKRERSKQDRKQK